MNTNRIKEIYQKNTKLVFKSALILGIVILTIIVAIKQNCANEISLDTAERNSSKTEAQTTEYYVDISGAVKNPGVYKVKSKTRLVFLIDKAGGLTKNADLDAINQASYVEDGAKIIIPKKGENGGMGGATGVDSKGTEDVGVSAQGKININQASASELTAIPGVGTVIAQRIVEYRNGARFKSIEDIKNVKGIGEATFEKMKAHITV